MAAVLLNGCGVVDTIGVLSVDDAGSRENPNLGEPHDPADAPPAPGMSADAPAPAGPNPTPGTAAPPNPTTPPQAGGTTPPVRAQCSVEATAACSRDRSAAFARSLCSCNNLIGPRSLEVRAVPDGGDVAVGVNGSFAVPFVPSNGGWRPGPPVMGGGAGNPGPGRGPMPDPIAMQALGSVSIDGDLDVMGQMTFAGDVNITGDLFCNAAPMGSGSLRVEGEQVVPRPAPNAPCACDASARLDIAALTRDAAQNNDNAGTSLAPELLSNVVDNAELELGCGRFYLRNVGVLGTLTLRVSGHAVVFVDGDFLAGSVRVELADGAQLDFLVSGNFTSDGNARFAAPEHASRARVYIGGQLLLVVALDRALAPAPSRATLVGNFYAPNATLQLTEPLTLHGSLFVNQLFLLQGLTLHSSLPRGGVCGF